MCARDATTRSQLLVFSSARLENDIKHARDGEWRVTHGDAGVFKERTSRHTTHNDDGANASAMRSQNEMVLCATHSTALS